MITTIGMPPDYGPCAWERISTRRKQRGPGATPERTGRYTSKPAADWSPRAASMKQPQHVPRIQLFLARKILKPRCCVPNTDFAILSEKLFQRKRGGEGKGGRGRGRRSETSFQRNRALEAEREITKRFIWFSRSSLISDRTCRGRTSDVSEGTMYNGVRCRDEIMSNLARRKKRITNKA